MPGSEFELVCPGCATVHSFSTGADFCIEHHERWRYEQRVCRRCELIVSHAVGCCLTEPETCRTCSAELERWAGRVWFETDAAGHPIVERVAGPCPRCGTTVRESDSRIVARWD